MDPAARTRSDGRLPSRLGFTARLLRAPADPSLLHLRQATLPPVAPCLRQATLPPAGNSGKVLDFKAQNSFDREKAVREHGKVDL